ncbi:MAG: Nif3-like dinuclear metal center hexameric protein [Lentisphaerae bacterium]|nr:Nif3-like dinuclear metal center hexameric protein [Lentisphaerota bacterium]
MLRDDLVKFLDNELDLAAFSGDVSNNGLQIEGKQEVNKILFAVDACQQTFDIAVKENADFIFVHHGLSWGGGLKRWTGIDAKRFATLFKHDISLYAAHLPLDAHPVFGNNAVLSDIVDLRQRKPFFNYDGVDIGFSGILPQDITLKELAEKLSSAIGGTYLLRGEPDRICRKAAVVSGGGGVDSVIEAARIDCDLLITGEMEHIMHHAAMENNVAVIALGHYASETTGPKALMKLIARTFNIPTIFADCPTGL